MSCSTIRRKMDRALDSDAAARGLASEIESHTGACAACRKEWESLQFADRALRTPKPLSAPPGMLEDFHRRRTAERQAAPRRRPGWWLSAGVATAAACAAIFSFRIGVPLPTPAASRIVPGSSPALLREVPAGFGFSQAQPGGGSAPARVQSDPNEYARRMIPPAPSGADAPKPPPSGAVPDLHLESPASPAAKPARLGESVRSGESEALALSPPPSVSFRFQRDRKADADALERRDLSRAPGVGGAASQNRGAGQQAQRDFLLNAGSGGTSKEGAGQNGRPAMGADGLGQVLASLRREVELGAGERSMSQIGAAVSEQLGISVQTGPSMGDRVIPMSGGSEPAWRLLQRVAAENGAVIVPGETGVRLLARDAVPMGSVPGVPAGEPLVRPVAPTTPGGGAPGPGNKAEVKDALGGRGAASVNTNAVRGGLGVAQSAGMGGFGGGQQAAPSQNTNSIGRGAPSPANAAPSAPAPVLRRQSQSAGRFQVNSLERSPANGAVQNRGLAQNTRTGPPGFVAELWIGWGDLPARVLMGTGPDRTVPRRE